MTRYLLSITNKASWLRPIKIDPGNQNPKSIGVIQTRILNMIATHSRIGIAM